MTTLAHPRIKLFVFPRMFAIPNVSPFCCKLETWLRIARIPYDVVPTVDPRKSPRRKLPFIEDGDQRIPDTSRIVRHLVATRGIDLDAGLDDGQRATALLVQRTLEEHYAFVLAYTHLVRDEGVTHTRARFDALPAILRGFVANRVRRNVRKLVWTQGVGRQPEDEIFEASIADWRAVLAMMSDGPFFFGGTPTTIDATVFGTLAPTVLTPIESPVRDFLLAQPKAVAYAKRMRSQFFPELAATAKASAA